VTAKHIRSSESCPLVPAATYLTNPKFIEIRQANSMPHLVREVDLAWHVSEQAAQLLGQSPEAVEPLQVVRYTSPAAEYHVHHDHGGFYGKSTEARPWTVLVFLAQPFDGGYTSFPKLVLDVLPRTGDALVWRNVLSDDTADPEMVHAGLPPTRGEKYALNVWFSNTNDKANLLTGLWGTTQVARKLYNKE
jgi:prolyl 4-hydroxylase